MNMKSIAIAAATILAMSSAAFADCVTVQQARDNGVNAVVSGCAAVAMNGVAYTDYSLSADCGALSIAPTNPAQHLVDVSLEADASGVPVVPNKFCEN